MTTNGLADTHLSAVYWHMIRQYPVNFDTVIRCAYGRDGDLARRHLPFQGAGG